MAAKSTEQAKEIVVTAIAQGATVEAACKGAGRSIKTYENWRASDADFKRRVDEVREARNAAVKAGVDPADRMMPFAEWRKKFLGRDTYPHQRAWIDVLEGRGYNPRPGETYIESSNPNRIIVNVPPFHAKSQTLTIEYATYRICMDPNIRIILVSKRQDQARKFLYAIKQRLTSTQWAALQATYAPEGGFRPTRGDGATWGADRIYVAGIDSGEKDPTVEALGMGGQIYGSRADLIILDDCIVSSNAAQFEQQITWLESEVESRAFDGKIIIIGTRIQPTDLYSELQRGDRYLSGETPWTVLRQPAVLEYADDPSQWKTLWPASSNPMETGQQAGEDGMYPAWDGPRLNAVRNAKPPRVWSLVYMQADAAEDAVFPAACVLGSVDRRRKPGPLRAGAWGHPRNGAEGMHTILSIDPAGTGEACLMVLAVERSTKKRWVLNVWLGNHTTPSWYRARIEEIVPEYNVNQVVIEQNAYASWLIHDEQIVDYLKNRGIPLGGHYTSKNKADPDFGVASMSSLFGSLRRHTDGGREVHNDDNLIQLPDPDYSAGVKALIDQLIAWQPGKQGRQLRQDGPMALWFAELKARPLVTAKDRRSDFLPNSYLSRGDRESRRVVPMDLYRGSMSA